MGFLKEHLGQSLVEMALTMPLLVFGLISGADVARAFAVQLAVQNGARAGAEAAAITFTPTEQTIKDHARYEMSRTPGLNAANAIITVTFKQADGLSTCVDPPNPTTPCYATVRVQYVFRTVTPWPWIQSAFTFDRSTTVRTIKGGVLP